MVLSRARVGAAGAWKKMGVVTGVGSNRTPSSLLDLVF